MITGSPKPRGSASQDLLPAFRLCTKHRTQDLRAPVIEGGFPHSEICGSKVVRTSPQLIAAYHVLHRLSAPRHPPYALQALDCSYHRYPRLGRSVFIRAIARTHERHRCSLSEKTSLLRRSKSGDVGVAWPRSRANKKLYNIRFRFPSRERGRMSG